MLPIRAILLCWLFFAAMPAFAQRAVSLTVDSSLHPGTALPVKAIRVLDARYDTSGIGFIKTGAFNRFAILQVEGGFAEGLEKYLNYVCRDRLTGSGELLLVVHHFLLQDMQKGQEIATIRIQADIFKGGDGAYSKVRSVDSFYEMMGKWDVSEKMEKTACAMLLNLAVDGAMAPVPAPAGTYTAAEALTAQQRYRSALPAYSASNMRRGIYRSYEDFLQLRSADTDFIDRRMIGGNLPPVISIHLKNEKGQRGAKVLPADCYAVCDGKRWYYALESGYRDMRWDGSNYLVNLNLSGTVDHRQEAIAAGAAFGLLGAALASAGGNKGVVTYEVELAPEEAEWHLVRRVMKP